MKTSLLLRTLVVILALEWDNASQDPVIFCYRIGVEPARAFVERLAWRR